MNEVRKKVVGVGEAQDMCVCVGGVRGWPPGLLHHSVPGLGSGQDRGRSGPGSD